MLTELKGVNYINRLDGVPLFYNSGLHVYPITPPYSSFDYHPSSPKIHKKPNSCYLNHNLTPPLSPNRQNQQNSKSPEVFERSSVIMKVENHQIKPTDNSPVDHEVCKWANCYRRFDSLDLLANHVTLAHALPDGDNYYYCRWEQCPRTDRGFNARYKMLVHVRVHTKEKPHQCNECLKRFSRAENLKIHQRSHSGERPYHCPVEGCNKAYSNSSDRFKHTRTHQNDKPYCCKVEGCKKRYTDPSSLRKHVKTFKHENLAPKFDKKETKDYVDQMSQLQFNEDKFYYPDSPESCSSDKIIFEASDKDLQEKLKEEIDIEDYSKFNKFRKFSKLYYTDHSINYINTINTSSIKINDESFHYKVEDDVPLDLRTTLHHDF